jgi:hypothetical protein
MANKLERKKNPIATVHLLVLGWQIFQAES